MTPENFCYWLKGYLEEKPDQLIQKELLKTLAQLELKDKRFHYVPTPSQKEIDEIRNSLLDSCEKTAYEQIIDKETKAWINAGAENWTCGYKPPQTPPSEEAVNKLRTILQKNELPQTK